ncbi:hypothetical protein ACHAWF_005266 [Thalassiosira exigua]
MGSDAETEGTAEMCPTSPPAAVDRSPDEKNYFDHSPFPYKLYAMLELTECSGITWSPDGLSFKVTDEREFMDSARMFFKQTKIRSFHRQLNLWGFQRLGPQGSREWRHDLFVRGAPEKLKKIIRVKVKGRRSSKARPEDGMNLDYDYTPGAQPRATLELTVPMGPVMPMTSRDPSNDQTARLPVPKFTAQEPDISREAMLMSGYQAVQPQIFADNEDINIWLDDLNASPPTYQRQFASKTCSCLSSENERRIAAGLDPWPCDEHKVSYADFRTRARCIAYAVSSVQERLRALSKSLPSQPLSSVRHIGRQTREDEIEGRQQRRGGPTLGDRRAFPRRFGRCRRRRRREGIRRRAEGAGMAPQEDGNCSPHDWISALLQRGVGIDGKFMVDDCDAVLRLTLKLRTLHTYLPAWRFVAALGGRINMEALPWLARQAHVLKE